MGLLDILKQYANPTTAPTGDVYGHFDSVAEQSKPEELGSGVAAALRSDATPPFGQTIGNLFGQSKTRRKRLGCSTKLCRHWDPQVSPPPVAES
jgi:hypothetical protein